MRPLPDSTNRERVKPSPANWWGFAMMCIGMFMAILDVQVVATSLPTIQKAFGIEPAQMSWVQTAYLIAEVVAIPLTGFLTRTLTMRWLFVVSIIVFTVSSIGCASSDTFTGLVAWRIVQGLSGGTLIPAVFSAVFLLFSNKEEGLATSIAGILAVLAPTVGPIVGGWITDTLSWHWLFLINVLPGLLSAAIASSCLPRQSLRLANLVSLDVLAVLLMAVCLGTLEIALKEAPTHGWLSIYVALLLFLVAGSMVAFVLRTLRSRTPIVDLRVLKNTNFTICCILSFILGMSLFGSLYLMPVFLAFVRGHTAFEIGCIMLATGVAQLLTAPLVVKLEQRIDARLLTGAGFALLAIGLAWSASQTPRTDFSEMLGPQILRGVAFMFCLLPPTRLAFAELEDACIPDASGLFNLMRNLGGAIGIALIDTIVFGRAKMHADVIASRLQSADPSTAAFVGIPVSALRSHSLAHVSPQTLAILKSMVEKAATTQAINEAWFMVALLTSVALFFMPFTRVISRRLDETHSASTFTDVGSA
jgi:MFS transporter, DHA2 family, multidrug resistance protein